MLVWLLLVIVLLTVLFFTIVDYRDLKYFFTSSHKKIGALFIIRNGLKEQVMHEWVEKNKPGDFYLGWFIISPALVAVTTESVKFILTDKEHVQKEFMQSGPISTQKMLGRSIIAANGADWRRQKNLYSSAFGQEAYKYYFPTFLDVTNKCMLKFSEARQKGDVEITDFMSKFTLDVLGRSIFQIDFQLLDGNTSEYYEAYKDFIQLSFHPLFVLLPKLADSPLPLARKLTRGYTVMKDLLTKIIEERRTSPKGVKTDILTHLIQASESSEQGLTEEELMSNVFVLFVAGHDTTSGALAWVFYELSRNPDIQNKLYNQIIDRIGSDRDPTFEDISSLPYLDMILHESMRMHPPITNIVSRKICADVNWKGTILPKGTMVGFDIYHMHHSPQYWDEPYTFNPDRFSPENKKQLDRFQYLPFSLGPRQCIGNTFSLIEQHIFIVKLIQTFQVLPPETHSADAVRGNLFNAPATLHVKLVPRASTH